MNDENSPIRQIVIVGGGTAGWIAAGRIAAEFADKGGREVKVTLVESPNVKPIGVGEGTWPTMRTTLMKLGISESDFIRECNATFKQGAKFKGWVTGTPDDYYYHPLMLPQGFDQVNIASGWHQCASHLSFSDATCFQEALCERGLAPKRITTAEYQGIANYAYHLDAGKFTGFLQRHVTEKLSVQHVLADVVDVLPGDNDDIAAVRTRQAGDIHGDLFIDCSGFSSLLLDKHYRVPFIDRSDVLFIDRALAVQVPYERADSPIASHTISTAQKAGWIWDIGLQTRRGVGYVYSSQHTSRQAAEKCLGDYLGSQSFDITSIPIRCGHRQEFWRNNCVAVGLAAGFLEPLEASALVLVELSATMLAEQLPATRAAMSVVAKRFNRIFRYRWDRIIDFLKLHYVLTQRNDSDFWRDNRNPDSVPDSLKELLLLWQHRSPSNSDFDSTHEVFPAASYQYVLYGMGFREGLEQRPLPDGTLQYTQRLLQQVAQQRQRVADNFPNHRDLIDKIQQYGLAKV